LIHEVLVLVACTNVHLHYFIVWGQHGCDIWPVKGFLQDMAVVAPVGAKDEEQVLAGLGGAGLSGRDLLPGIAGGIDFRVDRERLLELGHITLGRYQSPDIALLLPELFHNYVDGASRRGSYDFRLKGNGPHARLRSA